MVKKITLDAIKEISGEGLVFQGCGGDLKDWVDGINEMLTEENILKNGNEITNVSVFENNNVNNLLFILDDVDLDLNKLVMWRMEYRQQFSVAWLSDYVSNSIEKDTAVGEEKPHCNLEGTDGNIFNLMGLASRALKQVGQSAEAKEMNGRITSSTSYTEALSILMDYVDIDEEPEIDDEFDR